MSSAWATISKRPISDLLRRRIGEDDSLAETIGLIGCVEDADGQPDAAGDQGGRVQALPDIETEDEAQHGRQACVPASAIAAHEITYKGSGVDSHEPDDGAEVE